MIRAVLSQARLRVRERENLRFERTRLFAVVREIFCAMGDLFYEEGLIGNSCDIFYLTKQEIFGMIEGGLCTGDPKTLISLRRAQFDAFGKLDMAQRFETYGAVSIGNTFKAKAKAKTDQMAGADVLRGTGCCGGIVRSTVRIVTDCNMSGDLTGHILVANRTDPGWTPLFSLVKGLLVERGSLLSHSAIVAREIGLPAIVGIDGLLNRLKDGQMVEMDGSTGTVRIIPVSAGEEADNNAE
jgi:pyruvate,water dikinase